MRTLIIGILILIAWLIFSTWYYSNYLYPAFNPSTETGTEEVVNEEVEAASESPVIPDRPAAITLYFNYNESEILDASELDSYIPKGKEYLEAVSGSCLMLTGYTCDIGTESYNLELGTRRAEAARSYILKHGFSSECIQMNSKGEADPAVPNLNEANRKMNRRVRVTINP